MKLNWLFSGSMGAHHLVYAYVAVWIIQGGYAGWVAWQWIRTGRNLRPDGPFPSESDDPS